MPRESVRPRSVALLRELVAKANRGPGQPEGYSVRELADRLPCGKSMVHALLSGTKTQCSKALGDRIAEVLGVPSAVLFAPVESTSRGRTSRREDAA